MNAPEYHDGWTELAAAIVGQACKDYVRALICHSKDPEKDKPRKDIRDSERFFHSGWYEMLCDVDADVLVIKLRHMARDRIRKAEVV